MKPGISLATFVVVAAPATFSLLYAADPAADKPAPAVPAMTAEFSAPDDPAAAEIRSVGERAINRVAYSMVTEASMMVTKEGATAALATCHLKFIPSTGDVIHDMPRVTALKRTSLKLRDTANAPDAADQLALDKVKADIDAGATPARLFVQHVTLAGGASEWRVYRPVGIAVQCLACHGDPAAMSDELRAELKRRFPNDAATGYKVGEWRGLIRVTIAPPAPPPAPKAPGKLPPTKKS